MLKSWETVYIHKDQEAKYRQYVIDNLSYILGREDIAIAQRAQTLVDVSSHTLAEHFKDAFAESGSVDHLVEGVQQLVSKAISFIADIDSLDGIARLIGHDYNTHTHSVKVAWLMAAFVNDNRDLFPHIKPEGFRSLLLEAAVAGYLHDIGKIKIPKAVLNKKGKLDNLEYVIVQCHTAYSLSLLFEAELPASVKQAILYHHENEDGSGYPCGKKEHQIPLLAKICHIVDVFDALTSKRDYKEAKTVFAALQIMAGLNPHLEILRKFEKEARETVRTPVTAIVRDNYDEKLKRLREREMLEEEAGKRVEARMRLRDQGMSHCFDKDLLKRFIFTINRSKAFNPNGLS